MTGSAVSAGLDVPREDSSAGSITRLIAALQGSHEATVNQLLKRLYESSNYRRAVRWAQESIAATVGGQISGEDILQDALMTLAERARSGKLNELDSRKRLFAVLQLVVASRIRDTLRKARALKRIPERQVMRDDDGSRASSGDLSLFRNLPGRLEPDAEERVWAGDVLRQLQCRLEARYGDDPRIRAVLTGLLYGLTLQELMEQLGATAAEVRTTIEKIRLLAATLCPPDFPV